MAICCPNDAINLVIKVFRLKKINICVCHTMVHYQQYGFSLSNFYFNVYKHEFLGISVSCERDEAVFKITYNQSI